MKSYNLPLKVCDTKGKVVIAKVEQIDKHRNRVTLPYLSAIEKDREINFPDGKFKKFYDRVDHKDFISKLTKYLESIFFKELDDEDNNPSKHVRNNSAGADGSADKGSGKSRKGKKLSGLHDSGGGRESSSSDRGRKPKPDVAESGSSES